jgi:hypothetical protein
MTIVWKGLSNYQNENDKHMEIIKCIEKENDIYKERETFFMYALLLS